MKEITRLKLSELYFKNYTSTPEEIEIQTAVRVNKQLADYLQITNKVHTI